MNVPKPTTPVAGARAGRYLFVRQITTSYTGALWEARCEADGGKQFLALARVVTLPSEMDAGVEECLASAAWDGMELDGEGIARVAEVVFEKGWFAIVHDHYDGDTLMTLQRRITERKSAFPVPVALRILLDAIEAAKSARAAAKELDLPWQAALHPGSLFLCDDGRTRLLDGFMSGVIPTIPNMVRETDTLAYAAPEQFERGVVANETSDVFALGIVAWELLSSKRFQVGSRQVMERRLQTPPSRVDQMSRVGKRASRAVAEAVNRALSNEPAERFDSLEAFAKALRGGDDGVANQQEVVEFTDALAGRESTLARLLMDKPPRLSDELRSGRPASRPGDDDTSAEEPRTKTKKKAGRAPDAMFTAPGPVAARAAKAPGPAIFGAKAASSAGRETPAQGAKSQQSKYGSPLAPPLTVPNHKQTIKFAPANPSPPVASKTEKSPSREGGFRPLTPVALPKTPPAMPTAPAAVQLKLGPARASSDARPIAAVPAPGALPPKPRGKFNTLIGLSAGDAMQAPSEAARARAPEPDEPPRDPDSGITAVDAKHQRFDDADEEPTTIFRIGDAEPPANPVPVPPVASPVQSTLDLSQDEQELETREYTSEMLAEALGEVPESPTQRPAAPLAAAQPPAVRLPAPSSPGFDQPNELPALEHSGPPAVLPALKPAALPETSRAEQNATEAAPFRVVAHYGAVNQAEAATNQSADTARGAASPQPPPASLKRYRVVAFFFAGTTALMAAAIIALFVYGRDQAPAPEPAAETVKSEAKAPVAVAERPEASPKHPAALVEPKVAEEPSAAEAGKQEDGNAEESDSEDEKAAQVEAEHDSAEAAAAQTAAPKPKPVRRSKPRRSKAKAKSKPARYVPTDI